MGDQSVESYANSGVLEGGAGPDDRRAVYGAFAQEDFYLEVWQPALSGAKSGYKFNLAAAVFGMTWCFYRKMYGVGLILLTSEFIVGIVIGISIYVVNPEANLESQGFSLAMTGVTLLAIRVPFGFLANRLYFRKATAEIETATSEGQSQEQLLAIVRRRGGTSGFGIAVAVAINFVVRLTGM